MAKTEVEQQIEETTRLIREHKKWPPGLRRSNDVLMLQVLKNQLTLLRLAEGSEDDGSNWH